jgi:hypothetical protein
MSEEVNSIELSNYGDRKEIKELANRLRVMMPGGQKYTESEALTLAQIAIAHDLDPFNGEVWLIKDDTSGKVYGALVGIKGHRKHAKRQANYWGEFNRVVEVEKYNAPAGSIVYEYLLYDDKTLGSHQKLLDSYIKSGMKLSEVIEYLGRPPATIGIGIWSPGDKSKMKPVQCAMFRAEKDALKRRFDVKFRIELNGQSMALSSADEELNVEEIENEYDTIIDSEFNDEPLGEDELLEELGYDVAPQTGKSLGDELVELKLCENIHSATNLIKKLSLDNVEHDKALEMVRAYRGWRDMGDTPDNAAKAVLSGKYPK